MNKAVTISANFYNSEYMFEKYYRGLMVKTDSK